MIDPKSTKPKPRALGHPLMTEGANRNQKVDVDKMVEDYWQQLGWNTNTGKPNDEAMKFDSI